MMSKILKIDRKLKATTGNEIKILPKFQKTKLKKLFLKKMKMKKKENILY